mmetsp:Transcript_10056/g.23966  ORF Transcript_10056/g.23966 Transcript_10056/m.23966 type:complete len:130 (-) Transcript_10056:807-1196(-)
MPFLKKASKPLSQTFLVLLGNVSTTLAYLPSRQQLTPRSGRCGCQRETFSKQLSPNTPGSKTRQLRSSPSKRKDPFQSVIQVLNICSVPLDGLLQLKTIEKGGRISLHGGGNLWFRTGLLVHSESRVGP